MRRRDFIGLLGGAAAMIGSPIRAQAQTTKVPRLGILIYSSPQTDPNTESVLRGLRDLGYVDGRTIAIEYRFAEGRPERLPELAAELTLQSEPAVCARRRCDADRHGGDADDSLGLCIER
jgi:putative ABC transport system substrate-binding protein